MRMRCINFRTCGNWATRKGKCAACLRAKDRQYKNPVYQANRAAVLAAAQGACHCPGCGVCHGECPRVATTVDHITPLERGGTSAITNLRSMCLPCNSSKKAG